MALQRRAIVPKLILRFSFSATIPTVIEELGYSAAHAQLLTIPLYVFAAILTITLAFLADRAKTRWYFIVLGFGTAVVGFIAQLAIPHPKYPGLTYGFLFPVAGGMYSGYPPMISWMGKSNGHPAIWNCTDERGSKQHLALFETCRWHGFVHLNRKHGFDYGI